MRFASYTDNLGLKFKYIHNPYYVYDLNPEYKTSLNKYNSFGLRGDEIIPLKNGYRILCIGGSTTYTACVQDYKKSYPSLLEKELKKFFPDIEVLNAGISGYTTYESLIRYITKLQYLRPDLVIVYHSTNDIWGNRRVKPELFKSDASNYRKLFGMEYYNNILWFAEDYLLSLRIIMKMLGKYEFSIFNLTTQQKNMVNQPQKKLLKLNGFEYYESNLEDFILLTTSKNIKIIIPTFAYCSKYFLPSQKEFLKNGYIEQNEVIKNLCKKYKLKIFDFNKKMSENEEYWQDIVHVNEKGSLLKAKIFAEFLLKNNYIK
jgi:lysophospholipase L1-like esterase